MTKTYLLKKPEDLAALHAVIAAWPQQQPQSLLINLFTLKSITISTMFTRVSKTGCVEPEEWAAIKARLKPFIEAHDGEIANAMDGEPTLILVGPPAMYRQLLAEPDMLKGIFSVHENEVETLTLLSA